MMVPYIYDAGALIALDNNHRRMAAIHSQTLTEGREVVVPSIVVGQAWRDGRRQVLLGRILAGCKVEPVGIETAKAAGILCGKARTRDVVDATVVVMAAALKAVIWTSGPGDISKLIDVTGTKPRLVIRTV